MATTEERDDATTSAVCAAVLGAVFSVAALGIAGWRAACSVAIGAAIGVANLVMMRAIVRAVIRAPLGHQADETPESEAQAARRERAEAPEGERTDHDAEGRRGGAAWSAFALFKIIFLFGGIYLLLTRGLVDPIPLVIGYGVLPLGIAASTVVASLRPRRQ